MVEVPKSIRVLTPLVDYAVELWNAPGLSDVKIVTPGVTWDSFQDAWKQPPQPQPLNCGSQPIHKNDMPRTNNLAASVFPNEKNRPPLIVSSLQV